MYDCAIEFGNGNSNIGECKLSLACKQRYHGNSIQATDHGFIDSHTFISYKTVRKVGFGETVATLKTLSDQGTVFGCEAITREV